MKKTRKTKKTRTMFYPNSEVEAALKETAPEKKSARINELIKRGLEQEYERADAEEMAVLQGFLPVSQ